MTFSWKIAFLAAALAFTAQPVTAAESGTQPGATGPIDGKSYQIRNKQYGDLLRPRDANSANGTAIVLYPAQAWKCMTWRLSSVGDARFALQNHFTSKTFTAGQKEEGATRFVSQVPLDKEPAKRPDWQFTKLPDGSYKIMDVKSGTALSAQKTEAGSEVVVGLQSWADRDNQKWELQEMDPAKLTM